MCDFKWKIHEIFCIIFPLFVSFVSKLITGVYCWVIMFVLDAGFSNLAMESNILEKISGKSEARVKAA